MTSALIVVVGQDRAADNRQVGVGSCEIAWKGLNDVQQALKGQPTDGHGKVLAVQKDAMLIKIGIGRILEAPLLSSQVKANNPMVGAGWMVQASLITFIFHAKLAGWIIAVLSLFSCRNLLGILFWLREIDGDFQISIFSRCFESNIFSNSLDLDIVILLTKLVKISYSLLGIRGISRPEVPIELARGRRD